MSAVDDGLVRYMAEYPDLEMTPGSWHHNISQQQQVSHGHVKRRLLYLLEAGLVERSGGKGAYYGISETGQAYADGEMSKEAMEELNPRADEEEDEDEEDGDESE